MAKVEIDLHAEKLGIEHFSENTILVKQLSIFEKEFDNAIKNGAEEVTVIHGVGNGTLRFRVQKHLSGHPHVANYKDAEKQQFGFGATRVKIK